MAPSASSMSLRHYPRVRNGILGIWVFLLVFFFLACYEVYMTPNVPTEAESMASAAVISGSVTGVIFVVFVLAALLYVLRR